MWDHDDKPDPLAYGATIVFFALVAPFVAPFWLLGKIAIWVERRMTTPRKEIEDGE